MAVEITPSGARTSSREASTEAVAVVSNRLPVVVQRGMGRLEVRRAPGGLVSALEPILRRHGGTWIGWAGGALRPGESLPAGGDGCELRPVQLSEAEVDGYYHGFANGTLWPLLHCFPTRTRFDRGEWHAYEQVNRKFAAAAAEAAAATRLFWVHDYQLMRVPAFLREARRDARIAFFLHVPFPPFDVFRLLPWDRDLLRGLLACDLIGFHVQSYARNFLDCVERLLGARVDHETLLIEHGNRTVRVGAFPIGIDFALFESLATAAPPAAASGERIVLGVDRLDYTKGIPERILAFERLLELHPEHREKVVLLQLAVPSRFQVGEYKQLKRQVDELVGRVNGRFATGAWSPIRYLYRTLPRERLAELYRDADVALVTPLRDGMNLVAKEFVACQVAAPGVLVLSRLAGAAETMREAILVNPYNLDATAEAIHRALTMNEPERRSRLVALRRRERECDVYAWAETFLAAALADRVALNPPSEEDFDDWLGSFLDSHHVALFLDYDGTLVPLCDHPRDATLSEAMSAALDACARRPDIDVAIVSGRAMADLRAVVKRVDFTYVANHGLEISGPDLPVFHHPDLLHYAERLAALATDLRSLSDDGAWVEDKGATLTLHYRRVDPARKAHLAENARTAITRAGFLVRSAHEAVEARPPVGWDKGQAILHVLRSRYGPSWSERVRVIYVGDDDTDEDAFRVLGGLGTGFRVGGADTPTHAVRHLPDVDAVQRLLEWLADRPAGSAACDRNEGVRLSAEPNP